MKIPIIGAISGIGLQTVNYGLDSGREFRAFSRTAENINLIHSRLKKFPEDTLDESDVANAVSGMDVVIQTPGVPFDVKLLTGPIEFFHARQI